jgi:hypothetical protein
VVPFLFFLQYDFVTLSAQPANLKIAGTMPLFSDARVKTKIQSKIRHLKVFAAAALLCGIYEPAVHICTKLANSHNFIYTLS